MDKWSDDQLKKMRVSLTLSRRGSLELNSSLAGMTHSRASWMAMELRAATRREWACRRSTIRGRQLSTAKR